MPLKPLRSSSGPSPPSSPLLGNRARVARGPVDLGPPDPAAPHVYERVGGGPAEDVEAVAIREDHGAGSGCDVGPDVATNPSVPLGVRKGDGVLSPSAPTPPHLFELQEPAPATVSTLPFYGTSPLSVTDSLGDRRKRKD